MRIARRRELKLSVEAADRSLKAGFAELRREATEEVERIGHDLEVLRGMRDEVLGRKTLPPPGAEPDLDFELGPADAAIQRLLATGNYDEGDAVIVGLRKRAR